MNNFPQVKEVLYRQRKNLEKLTAKSQSQSRVSIYCCELCIYVSLSRIRSLNL